tara:strand:+ start:350 stop:967 length:618 start_codon:yes stop_codon:yes gene_type:complete
MIDRLRGGPLSSSVIVRNVARGAGFMLRKEHGVRWTVDETEFRAGLAGKTRFTTQEGVRFRVSPKETRAAFISRWDSFDPRLVVPLDRRGVRTVYLLTAGTTEVMQTHIENVRLLARYTEGDEVVLDLVNPSNYDDSIGTFGFQHTSRVPAVWLSRNAHLDVYALRTDPGRVLASLEAEVLSQGIIFGVVAITLETAGNAGTSGH